MAASGVPSAGTSLRARLDVLLHEVGLASSGIMLEDAQNMAAAVGMEFFTVRSVIEKAEEALLGERAVPVAPRLPLSDEVPAHRQQQAGDGDAPHKRRRSGEGSAEERQRDAGDDAALPRPQPAPARSALALFSAERRAEVLKTLGLPPGAADSAAVDEALEKAWKDLDPVAKESYNACAAVEKQRAALDHLRRGVRSESHAPKIARRVREAIAIMGNAPKAARASGLFEGIVAALEDLDRRLGPRVRMKLGEHLGPSIVSKDAQVIARRVFGQLNGTRLIMLLRRWCDPASHAGTPAESVQRPVRMNKPGTSLKVHSAGPTSDETRGKVVEFLERILSRASHATAPSLSREIERELFAMVGTDPKEYRHRARALSFNLGASDGALLNRVVEGELVPAELVRLPAEELASEVLKAERTEERQKYYKSQVVVTERVPKRRHELIHEPPRGRAAERLAGEREEEEPLQSQAEAPAEEPETPAERPQALLDAIPREADAKDAPLQVCDEADFLEAHAGEAADMEDAALRLLEDTSNDASIAQLMQMMPPTPTSSSGSSSSDSDSESLPRAEVLSPRPASSAVSPPPRPRTLTVATPAASSSSSSSASPGLGTLAGLELIVSMGFDRGAAEAALCEARGNAEAAVDMLLGGGSSRMNGR